MQSPLRPDWRLPRRWDRVWEDRPGFFWPNCPCCVAASSQLYYVFGGVVLGGARQSTNYQWSSAWATKAALSSARDSMAGSTPTTSSSTYTYGGITNVALAITQSDSYTPDAWSTNTAMPTGVYSAAGVAISSLCYSWGGWNASTVTQSVNQQMTPGSPSTWATKTAMTAARAEATASAISTKGYNIEGSATTNYEYDPSGNSWATKTACPAPAKSGLSSFTISGTIYVMYGSPDAGTLRNDSYVVDTWSTAATPPGTAGTARYRAGSAALDASSVGWVTGGQIASSSTNLHSEYTPNAWSARTVVTTGTTHPTGAIA